ncbi:hypothetical protein EJB05_02629, partial [Eragrostis curvula]
MRGGGGGGRRGGRGRGGGGSGGGGYGRSDARRPGGAASRDDRDRRERRPDYSPGRRSPSPRRPARRPPRGDDDDRYVIRSNRGPTRGGRVDYGGDRDRSRGGDPPLSRRDLGYNNRHDEPGRGRREDYGSDRDLSRRREDYGRDRDLPGGGLREEYAVDRDRDLRPNGRREDYGGGRDGRREDYRRNLDPPREGRREDFSRNLDPPRDYERVPYREERDRYVHRDRGANGTYNSPPAYMLTDDPSDLNRPPLRSERKESYYIGGPGGRSIDKERELLGADGMTLRISATESGRTSALYQDRGSPPSRAALSRPPPVYPSVPPETGFLTGGSAMKAGDGFGPESTRFLHGDGKYGKQVRDPYDERGRGTGRHYSGGRDVPLEEDGGTDWRYPPADMPIHRDRETERHYSSRGMPGSDLVPCTQLKQIGDSSPSLLAKDRPYRMHSEPHFEPSSNVREMNGFVMPSNDSLGHGSGRAHRFSESPFEHGSGHSDEALLDINRQEHSKLALRAEPMEFDGHPYATRDPILDTYLASEDLRGNVPQNPRLLSGSGSLTGLRDERINHHSRLSHRMSDDEDSYKAILHDSDHNLQNSDGVHASVPYPPARGGNGRYSHSPRLEPIGSPRRPARQHEFASFEDVHGLSDQEVSPMISRKRYRSPAYPDYAMDMPLAEDRFTRQGYNSDDMDACDLSPRRMSRHYNMIDEDEYDARYSMPNNRGVFSRLALPDEISGEWTHAEQESHPHSNTLTYGHSKHKPLSQRLSRPFGHLQFGESSIHGRGRGLSKSGKKRMRGSLHQFHGGYSSPRNQFIRPNKFSKSPEDDLKQSEMNHEDAPECEDLPVQKDPPEGSEEFAKQVDEAFLKYSKILNESPDKQKKFRDASKGSLSCCVCGSVARKFPDIDALISHAYDTCKAGLKTKHLGFHKALCVLMGWNWHVAPDTSKSHHSFPAEEVNAMKRDLMLWPPVIVIHNSSIAIKTKDTEANIVSKEEIEGLLADIGIPREKVKICYGRPANQSVFVVKFQPTISGFQEAMRIHDHFSARNHGKEDFHQMRGGKGKQAAPVDNLEELLYAHIAVAEDLGCLDEETKRRCFIRSKMDIEAKANATLNLEP